MSEDPKPGQEITVRSPSMQIEVENPSLRDIPVFSFSRCGVFFLFFFFLFFFSRIHAQTRQLLVWAYFPAKICPDSFKDANQTFKAEEKNFVSRTRK
jgi:hypothetical protein